MFGAQFDSFTLTKMVRSAVLKKMKELGTGKFQEYKMINNVPEILPILVDLMSKDFYLFVKDIEWVSPKPPTFRVVLENEQYFYLSDQQRSWVAEVEGKRYYLLNLGEQERATSSIARLLRYGKPAGTEGAGGEVGQEAFGGGGGGDFPGGDLGGGAEVGGTEEAGAEEMPPGFDEFETSEPETGGEE